MKIIFNSDILFCNSYIKDKPAKKLVDFFNFCKKENHVIIIPETAYLEFKKLQNDFCIDERKNFNNAIALITKYGVKIRKIDAKKKVPCFDLKKFLENNCYVHIIQKPNFSVLKEAHRRTCLHSPPHIYFSKDSEMRDIIIWLIAINMAKLDKKALLISRDIIHNNSLGDEEALSSHLDRVNSIEDAFEYFGVHTEAGKKFITLLTSFWQEIVSKTQIPFNKRMIISGLSNIYFRQGVHGISNAQSNVKLKANDDKIISTTIEIIFLAPSNQQIIIRNIRHEGNSHIDQCINSNINIIFDADDYEERYQSLKEILES